MPLVLVRLVSIDIHVLSAESISVLQSLHNLQPLHNVDKFCCGLLRHWSRPLQAMLMQCQCNVNAPCGPAPVPWVHYKDSMQGTGTCMQETPACVERAVSGASKTSTSGNLPIQCSQKLEVHAVPYKNGTGALFHAQSLAR